MPTYYESWTKTCNEIGLTFPISRFYDYAGMSVIQIFDILIKEQLPKDTSITALYCEERKKYHHHQIMMNEDSKDKKCRNPPIDVVLNIVKAYHNKIPIGIASSGWKDHIIDGLKRYNILHYFDTIVTVEDDEVKNGKPHPDMYVIAAKKLGVDVKYCIGFEDADLGMEAIERANYLYACDVRLFHDYPRNIEKRLLKEASSSDNPSNQTYTSTVNIHSDSNDSEDKHNVLDSPLPSNDDDNFNKAREHTKQIMMKDKEEFFSEQLPLSQKEILQSILLAEDAAISGQSNFSTKDKIHYLDKVHVPSLEETGEDFDQYGNAKSTSTSISQKAWQFINGFKERR